MDLVDRHLGPHVEEALDTFRAVILHGARQCGKSTLARSVVERRGGTYLTLDDDAVRDAALADPDTLLVSWPEPLAIDEFQLGGDRVVRAVKRAVDRDPTPGRFLLTGSTNFLAVPDVSESLAGRARLLRLDPFSEAELAGRPAPSVEAWFDDGPRNPIGAPPSRQGYLETVCRGGYPEVVRLPSGARVGWFESYVETVTQRDLRELADIRRSGALPRLLRWVAASGGAELNASRASRDLEIDRATVTAYLDWLQAVFLVRELPAWSRSHLGRAARRPKLHLTDTGLSAAVLGIRAEQLSPPTATATGPLLESFVVNELARQTASSAAPVRLLHVRDHRGHEVDVVLERSDGAVVAFEVKATSSPTRTQIKGLEWFRDRLDDAAPGTFRGGVLLHTGDQAVTVGDRIHLRPISHLWS